MFFLALNRQGSRLLLVGASLMLIGTASLGSGSLDDIAKPKETDGKVDPKPDPKPDTKPNPKPEEEKQTGVMEFGARVISNMEHGFHIMDKGYKAVCVDGEGVVASANMDIYAAINGEVAKDVQNSNGYTPMKLRPGLDYIRQGATSGNCKLKVCLPKGEVTPGKDFVCDPRAMAASQTPDPERPVEYHESNVPYTVSGEDIKLKTNYESVSGFHPTYGFAAPGKAFMDYQSPIVIQFADKSAPDLTDVWESKEAVRFDLIGDGKPVRTGWISGQTALLAIDHNQNGKIDDGLELFGEHSSGGLENQEGKRWSHGFASLASLDSNRNGIIESSDEKFSSIKLWFDANRDGLSSKSELKTLKSMKVVSISLKYTEHKENGDYVKVAGNEVRLRSDVKLSSGKTLTAYDVWFNQRRFAERPVASK